MISARTATRTFVCGVALLLSAPAAVAAQAVPSSSPLQSPLRAPDHGSLDRALAAAIAEGNRHTEARVRREIGVRLYEQARYADARGELLAALHLYEALGDRTGTGWTLHYLGLVTYETEVDDTAREYWTRGLAEMEAVGDRRGQAQLVLDRARATRPGPEKTALLERGLRLAREVGDAGIEARVRYSLGEQQMWDGNFAASLETLEQARAGFERLGADADVALTFQQLGRLHLVHGDSARAERFYQRGIAILQRLGDKRGIAEATAVMANMHRVAGNLRQAAIVARRAIELWVEVGGVRRVNQERLRLAWIYIELGDHRRAKPLVDTVIQGSDPFTRDLAYHPMAEVHLALGEHEQTRHAADLAARSTREPQARPFILAIRAQAEDKLGRSGDALASIDEALGLAEQLRGQLVPTDPMKQAYAERVQRLFGFAVDLRARMGEHAAALDAAEQARARAFLDLLATRDASRADPRGDASELQSAAAAAHFSLADLTAAASRLQSTILTYWVGADRTIVWVVDGRGLVHTAVVPVSASRLTALVSQTWRNGGATEPVPGKDAGLFVRKAPRTRAWRVLHDLLIQPVHDHLPAESGALLTVIPHGPLSRLSFAGLRDARARYLVEHYALHYVPAGAVLAERQISRPASVAPAPSYLLVAAPAGSPGDAAVGRLAALPGAAIEIGRIGRLLPAGSVTPLAGASAREDRVRALMSGRRVVHFATHAVLYDDRPLDSFLALGPSAPRRRGNPAADDGRLTAREIYDVALDAELVVLSACRTAAGRITGDGIVGLTRAFFYAGTTAVLATLWELADDSGREAMPAFYRAWLNGQDKARALRAAQLALLSRLRTRPVIAGAKGQRIILEEDPFLWAGFVVVGEP